MRGFFIGVYGNRTSNSMGASHGMISTRTSGFTTGQAGLTEDAVSSVRQLYRSDGSFGIRTSDSLLAVRVVGDKSAMCVFVARKVNHELQGIGLAAAASTTYFANHGNAAGIYLAEVL